MAIELIDLGTEGANNGDGLRDGGAKINDNFTELSSVNGWGYYKDSNTTTPTQTFNSTPSKLLIDGLNPLSENSYLPLEIRGVSDLWDASTNSITPIGLGDSYELRIDLEMTATSSNPTRFTLALDIGTVQNGTNGTDSIVIVSESKTLKAGVPQRHSVSVPIFSLSNFIANNGSIWISADSGTITIAERSISLYRNSKGQL